MEEITYIIYCEKIKKAIPDIQYCNNTCKEYQYSTIRECQDINITIQDNVENKK
jgi:hypothetical protein